MADISTELNTIENAKYGVNVRQAIHDSLQKINEDFEGPENVSFKNSASGTLTVRRVGKIVFINGISIAAPFNGNSTVVIGTLDTKYRPDDTWRFKHAFPNTDNAVTYVMVDANGDITLVNGLKTDATNWYFSFSFPIP